MMVNRQATVEGDAAAALLERRWFAAFKAASGARAECEVLLDTMALTQAAWSRARVRLSELEALRDALGEELEAMDQNDERAAAQLRSGVMSAA
jgi:hypothetical protein